ncbi:MAG: radical SAM protein [Myxococcales bacterium]|nr:radical SAM protein [Myxococcales bacterium]
MANRRLSLEFYLAARRYRRRGVRRPFFVSWRITDRCTRRCEYCDLTAGPTAELEPAEARKLLREMIAAGTRWVNWTGGEPLLRPDLIALAREAAAASLAVSVNTNGDLLPEVVSELPAGTRIGLSLDGPEAVQDAIRGPGSAAATFRALEAARGRGLPVSLTCILTAANCDSLDYPLRIAAEQRLPISFQPVIASALGSERRHSLSPSPEQLTAAYARIAAEIRRGNRWIENSLQNLEHLFGRSPVGAAPCVGGALAVRITPDGSLTACWGRQIDGPERIAYGPISFADAFSRLRPQDCSRCWCSGIVEANLVARDSVPRIFARAFHELARSVPWKR